MVNELSEMLVCRRPLVASWTSFASKTFGANFYSKTNEKHQLFTFILFCSNTTK